MSSQIDPFFSSCPSVLERDIALMDAVREKCELTSDYSLGLMLGAKEAILAEIRSGAKMVERGQTPAGDARSLTAAQRLRAFDCLGHAWARDIVLMDRVKEKFELKSDRSLALMIGANKTVLSEMRSYGRAVIAGQTPAGKVRTLTALQRLRAFDRLGYAWAREAILAAFPDDFRDELLHSDNARTQAHLAQGGRDDSDTVRAKTQPPN